jgi:hypothetical protein
MASIHSGVTVKPAPHGANALGTTKTLSTRKELFKNCSRIVVIRNLRRYEMTI